MIRLIVDPAQKSAIAAAVLHALPDWFGQPASTEEYIRESAHMPFWAALEDNSPLGFIALKETSPYAAEIYVMGVLPALHRRGVGKTLFAVFETYAKAHGYRFLQVKTVREGRYPEYDRTNAFYRSLGFCELECFPTLWDESNPCQVYIKSIAKEPMEQEALAHGV